MAAMCAKSHQYRPLLVTEGGGLNRELASPFLKQSDHREVRASQTLRISLSGPSSLTVAEVTVK